MGNVNAVLDQEEAGMKLNRKKHVIEGVSADEWREKAFRLWDLLDDIDTASDIFKPRSAEEYVAMSKHINKKHRERFEILATDGYDLFIPGTEPSVTPSKAKEQ